MVREVLTVNVGECGINVGHTVWQQYCAEHNIECDGLLSKNIPNNNDHDKTFLCFFEEIKGNKFVPRNLMISLDPESIDNIKNNSNYNKIYHPDCLMYNNEGSGHIFARGHYTAGREILDQFNDRLRKLVDNCDNVQGFVINHCVSSGTGSGLTSLLLERMAVDYRRKSKIGFHIFASHDNKSNSVIESYNEMLALHWLLDHTESGSVFDNKKLYQLCENYLKQDTRHNNADGNYSYSNPITYQDMNILISKIESCWTTSLRFEGELNVDLNEYQSGLVPFPRLHFRIPSLAPLIPKVDNINNNKEITKVLANPKFNQSLVDGFVRLNYNIEEKLLLYDDLMNIVYKFYSDRYKTSNSDDDNNNNINKTYYDVRSINDLFEMVFDCDYFTVDLDPFEFDPEKDKCMAITVLGRGNGANMKSIHLSRAVQHVKKNKNTTFVEWCPTGFKVGQNENKLARINDLKNDNLNFDYGSVCCSQNNTAISRYFRNKFIKEFDKMYSQRAYVHWYIGEGMEEGEFGEAREDVGFFEKDYLDVLAEQATDEEDGDDDEY